MAANEGAQGGPSKGQGLDDDPTLDDTELQFQRTMIRDEAEVMYGMLSGDSLWECILSDSMDHHETESRKNPDEPDFFTRQSNAEDQEREGGSASLLISNPGSSDVTQIKTTEDSKLLCSVCSNASGDIGLTHLKSCGCLLCSSCIINAALNFCCERRNSAEQISAIRLACPTRKVPLTGLDSHDSEEHKVESCIGEIIEAELEQTLSPWLFESMLQLLNPLNKRSQENIVECTTPNCHGFRRASAQTHSSCSICKKKFSD